MSLSDYEDRAYERVKDRKEKDLNKTVRRIVPKSVKASTGARSLTRCRRRRGPTRLSTRVQRHWPLPLKALASLCCERVN